ncbi:hypothetical protein [Pseudonocardia sp. McavD-2-B]|uniref:hypothetical protein n=1 Tax=Pseudonocardia TaxID=1847 RepID=UPI002098163A|nr:hypothetical protein [Pseudonocardia sp. McavD-2-B]MCO7194485.1 hypothetical protein [Pseudonocardia sp. McavD-2-B]
MMEVVDHEPHWWFLLRDGDRLYLDVNCEHSFIGYAMLVELDDGERRAHEAGGHAYLGRLAEDVNAGAPVLRDSRSPYRDRNLSRSLGPAVTDAVRRWRAAGGTAP